MLEAKQNADGIWFWHNENGIVKIYSHKRSGGSSWYGTFNGWVYWEGQRYNLANKLKRAQSVDGITRKIT